MSLTAHVYTRFAKSLADKLVELETDSLKVMLLSAYTPGQDSHQFVSDVKGAGTEVTGVGYSAGGVALSSVTLTEAGHVFTLGCNNPTWAASTITASYAVFYDATPGSDATNPVLCYWDFGGPASDTAGTFQLTISGSGLLTFTGS